MLSGNIIIRVIMKCELVEGWLIELNVGMVMGSNLGGTKLNFLSAKISFGVKMKGQGSPSNQGGWKIIIKGEREPYFYFVLLNGMKCMKNWTYITCLYHVIFVFLEFSRNRQGTHPFLGYFWGSKDGTAR